MARLSEISVSAIKKLKAGLSNEQTAQSERFSHNFVYQTENLWFLFIFFVSAIVFGALLYLIHRNEKKQKDQKISQGKVFHEDFVSKSEFLETSL